jgi:predicted esterase YcpF (UPF0227 family)
MTAAIVYLHGFNSSPQSVKGRVIAQAAAQLPDPPLFHFPRLADRPAQAIRDVCAWVDLNANPAANVASGRDLAFIGSSLGGYYATWLAEKYDARAILINPAIRPYDDLRAFAGRQRNLHTGEEYDVTPAHFDELAALAIARVTQPDRYFLLVRTGDELLDWRRAAAFYAGGYQYVAGGGDHGWEDFDDEVGSVLRFAGCVAEPRW